MSRGWTHPNLGRQVKLEKNGCEVMITIVTNSEKQALDFYNGLSDQLDRNEIHLDIKGSSP